MYQQIQLYPVTFFFVFLIGGLSIYAFSNPEIKNKLIFSPYRIKRTNEWYRFLTSGFIHADYMHLIFNGYVFFQFSKILEMYFTGIFGETKGPIFLALLFLSGIIVSHLTSYKKHVESPWYASLGASGGVSSVLYAFIFLAPTAPLGILFIPFDIPAIILGVGYLLLSNYYAVKGSRDNVNHEAHYIGSLWGVVFMVLVYPASFYNFFYQIIDWLKI